jgi:DNA-directed RNA polymerase subunit RPC12/RpoP
MSWWKNLFQGAPPTEGQNVTGPSKFWRCPECSKLLKKQEQLGLGSTTVGFVTCGECGASLMHQAVYGGTYDVAEVLVVCDSCSTELQGPRELFGDRCPACGNLL